MWGGRRVGAAAARRRGPAGRRSGMDSAGDPGGRGQGGGAARRPTAGPRRPGQVQAAQGRRAGGARRLGQLSEGGHGPLASSLSLPPHLQDPNPSRPARRCRFRWLRGLQRARGHGLHLPHWRPRISRDARPARRREPRRRARAAGGLAPPPRPRP